MLLNLPAQPETGNFDAMNTALFIGNHLSLNIENHVVIRFKIALAIPCRGGASEEGFERGKPRRGRWGNSLCLLGVSFRCPLPRLEEKTKIKRGMKSTPVDPMPPP